MSSVLVTGGSGQIGSEIKDLSAESDFEFFFFDKSELDITNEAAVIEIINKIKPSIIINAAAYTNVDGAEDNESLCYSVNVEGVKNIAKQCLENKIFLLHYSSDYVYNHNPDRPLRESDENHPIGVYAKSKLASEKEIIKLLSDFVILRTSWVYSKYGKNFVDTMIYYGKEREKLQVVHDQVGTPTYAKDIAETSLAILEHNLSSSGKKIQGVYNYSNEGVTNWADYAKKIFDIAKISCVVEHVSTERYNARAHRPAWSVMDKKKLKTALKLEIPNWEDSLSNYISSVSR